MIPETEIRALKSAIRSQLVSRPMDRLSTQVVGLLTANSSLYGNDPTRQGFLVGSDLIVPGRLPQDVKIQRRPPHPTLADAAFKLYRKMEELKTEERVINQACDQLYAPSDDRQHIRDVIPDNLFALLHIPDISLPGRSIPEELVEKMGPTGSNFILLKRYATERMIDQLLKE